MSERIRQEMRNADALRADMKQSILQRAGGWLGDAYGQGQQWARESGLMGALGDIYRRVFENGWFNKDVFDGRFHHDNNALGGPYDTRAQFYGLDKGGESEGQDTPERGNDVGRDQGLER